MILIIAIKIQNYILLYRKFLSKYKHLSIFQERLTFMMKKRLHKFSLLTIMLFFASNVSMLLAQSEAMQISLKDLNPYASESNAHHLDFFEISLNQVASSDISIDYYSRYGTAIPGQDYIPVSDTLIIAAGETKALISVQVLGDTYLESNETFEMVLSNPSADVFPLGTTEIATTHTIVNDDAPRNIDNTQAIARELSQTLLAGISPLLSIQTLLDQPARLANAFALNLDSLTLACPSSGTFFYLFTDSNADLNYSSVDDNLAVTLNQCRNTSTTSDLNINGDYNLQLIQVAAKTIDTEVTLNNVSIHDVLKNTTSSFTGILSTSASDPHTIDSTLLSINSNNLQLSSNNIAYVFSNISSQISTDIVSSEIAIQQYSTSLVLSDSSNDGSYNTAIIEALKIRPTERYPYTGKFTIQRQDGSINITVTSLNTTYVLIETDTNNDNISDYTQVVAWNQLSQGF